MEVLGVFHALAKLDWSSNAERLGQILSDIPVLDPTMAARAYEAARKFERQRQDLAFYFPFVSRALHRCASLIHPLAARYSGRH